MKGNFIFVSDKETADKLRSLGFVEIHDRTSNGWLFVNDMSKPQTFDDKKVAYTNIVPM